MPYTLPRKLLPGIILAATLITNAVLAAPPRSLTFTDDRGLPVQCELEACFQIETKSECSTLRKPAPIPIPSGAASLRVEGPEHGPVTLPRGAWEKLVGDPAAVAVPRKAKVEIKKSGEERLTLSLFPQDDPDFRRPSFRLDLPASGVAWVPVGEAVVSLTAPGRAADLHFLDAAPGGSYRLDFKPATGWSQILRCRSAREGTLLEGASVELAGTEGYTPPNTPARAAKSSRRGLVLFSGLPYLLAGAKVEHPRFVPRREEGLSATPGTFGFREIGLETGATLRAKVALEGRAAPGVRCQVLEIDPHPIGPAGEPAIRSETRTDREGICLSAQLAAGPYTLRLRLDEGRSFVDRSFLLTEGEESALDVDLQPILVHGKVVRGAQPAPSYVVLFSDQRETKPNGTNRDAQAEATTDEEGEYETNLWSPGDYFALLQTPTGTPAAHQRVRLASGEERVDFTLAEHGIGGTVVDERDRSIAEATVVLSWHSAMRMAKTDPAGTFFFPVSEEGEGELEALKPGYRSPPALPVAISAEAPLPPQLLRLRRAGLLRGKVVARGPVAGAGLVSYGTAPGGDLKFLGAARSGPDGGFELAAAEAGATRIYLSGPGCPLSPFTVPPTTEDLTLACPDLPASAEIRFLDPQGHPVAGKSVLARKDGVLIPAEILTGHLLQLHLPTASDGGGRLRLVGLAPGSYDLFLAEATSPELVAAGDSRGFLTSATLAPLATSELEVTLDRRP